MNEPSLDDQFLRPLWTFDTVNNKKVAPFSKVGKAQLEKFVTMPLAPTPPPLTLRLFLDFRAMSAPQSFFPFAK